MAATGGESCDLKSLISGEGRDFLVRNNGEQVSISDLHGKFFGLYFSASWCGPCRLFTPELVKFYNEASSKGYDFEVIFVSRDNDEDSFNGYFSEMPWLAVPFSDSNARRRLREMLEVRGIPHLEVFNESGQVINDDCVDIVKGLGIDAYPFTPEKADELKLAEEKARKEQTLRSLLVSPSTRDYLISKDGTKVPVSDLEGKIVALYFFYSEDRSSCAELTPMLAQIYDKLKEKGESFEVVLVSLDEEEASFVETFASMPWLALPFKDKSCEWLASYFELNKIPYLATIGADGKTMNVDFADIIEEHGVEAVEAFPFHQEKLDLLAEKAKKKMEAQTLESLLVSGDLDYIITKEGKKVQVKELIGKNILFYFSAKDCDFLAKLLEEYPKIKSKDDAFEIIFISSDEDQDTFEAFYSGMPWLALPFGDDRKSHLQRTLRISDTPAIVAIGPNGQTVTKDAKHLLRVHGADAYPFTEDVIQKLEHKIVEMAKGWPERMKHKLHRKHELMLTRDKAYYCDKCEELGHSWSYRCAKCQFDLHPNCALKPDEDKGETKTTDGCVCDEDACRKI